MTRPGRLYHTFMVSHPEQRAELLRVKTPKGWGITTRPDPSYCFWADRKGSSRMEMSRTPKASEMKGYNRFRRCPTLLIRVADEEQLENIVALIHRGVLLGYPDRLRAPDPTPPAPALSKEPYYAVPERETLFKYYDNLTFGLRFASSAWKNKSLVYAASKWSFSLQLDWFTPHSSSPTYGQMFPNAYANHDYHVRAAFAVAAAYSAIEDLGLDVRSSSANPRFIQGTNSWNPNVRDELEARLVAAGCDLSETYTWLRRGSPTLVEREMKPSLGQASKHARGDVVRDLELDLVDALHYASWLRNFVAAHRFRPLVEELGPYEVFNVQSLARRLIITSAGLWRLLVWP